MKYFQGNNIRVYGTFLFPHKILRNIKNPEYQNKKFKRLKVKYRKAYNRRKFGAHHLEELKRLPKQLFAAKKRHKGLFRSLLKMNVNAGLSTTST